MMGKSSLCITAVVTAVWLLGACAGDANSNEIDMNDQERLGRMLFFDESLSSPAGQSCASCHAPEAGFGDPNPEIPVSQGADPELFGNRNDLSAAYASFIPPLHYDEDEEVWVGGLFWDGRANTLEEQAKGPPLNPLEMANPNIEAIVFSIRAAEYSGLFRQVYGEDALEDSDVAYDYFADAIAAYERSYELNPFNSKYDAFLAGEALLTEQEMRGLALFQSETKGNCSACHPSLPGPNREPPLFTDFTYDNLGVPRNPESPFYSLAEEFNQSGFQYVDLGLGPVVEDPDFNGAFRVPTLRNVALTPPYMHNGAFKTLFQVVSFYNTRDVSSWPSPEVPANVNREELGNLGLTSREITDIVAFLRTLSDGYEGEEQ